MKIVLATALYPPDTAEPALYLKELAGRLALQHTVTLVIYGRLPETIPGVSFICVNKRHPLPLRITRFFFAMYRAARHADVVFFQNGPSVELPATLVSLLTRRSFIMLIGDQLAHSRTKLSRIRKYIENFAMNRSWKVITDMPEPKPEILPFNPRPTDDMLKYDRSWENHMKIFQDLSKNERE